MTDPTAKSGFQRFAMKDREAQAARQVAGEPASRSAASLPIVGQADETGSNAPATRADKTTALPR